MLYNSTYLNIKFRLINKDDKNTGSLVRPKHAEMIHLALWSAKVKQIFSTF